MKKYQMFDDYEGLFLNKKLKLSSNNFELSIYLHEEKEKIVFSGNWRQKILNILGT